MRYTIEFELPDNDTVLSEIGSTYVEWAVWGYSGSAIPKPVKKRESLKMLPCKCGCKRREYWCSSGEIGYGLRCVKCGFSVWGRNMTDAIRKWNEEVSMRLTGRG